MRDVTVVHDSGSGYTNTHIEYVLVTHNAMRCATTTQELWFICRLLLLHKTNARRYVSVCVYRLCAGKRCLRDSGQTVLFTIVFFFFFFFFIYNSIVLCKQPHRWLLEYK